MDERQKKSQLARLSRIEGQVRGVARMVEEDRYCIDVITQVRAVRAALDKVEQEILHDHLQHCVVHAFHGDDERERQTKIDELMEVLDSRRVMSASSSFGPWSSEASAGSSAMPQIGQLPGPTWRISGCIGQVKMVPGAAAGCFTASAGFR